MQNPAANAHSTPSRARRPAVRAHNEAWPVRASRLSFTFNFKVIIGVKGHHRRKGRLMVKKTKEITPVKAVLIYSIALVLVVFSELPRVLSWVEETRWKLVAGQMFDSLGANQLKFVSKTSDPADRYRSSPKRPVSSSRHRRMEAAQPVVDGCPRCTGCRSAGCAARFERRRQ